MIKCQDSRSRTVNRAIARKHLQDKIEEQMLGSESRTERKKALVSAKKKSKAKKARRKYRALEEGEEGDDELENSGGVPGEEELADGAQPVDKVKQEFEQIVKELAEQKKAEQTKRDALRKQPAKAEG